MEENSNRSSLKTFRRVCLAPLQQSEALYAENYVADRAIKEMLAARKDLRQTTILI